MLIGAVLLAAVGGALVVIVGSGGLGLGDGGDHVHADAGIAATFDAGGAFAREPGHALPNTQLRGVEVVIDALPSFKALQGVRAVLPPTQLRGYASRSATFLVIDAEAAGPLADRLQGLPLQSDLPLVLEVKELAPTRLVLEAVRPEDASALADAGALLDGGSIADAGDVDVVAPGGLAP